MTVTVDEVPVTHDGASRGCVWLQREISLPGRGPGFYLITDDVVGALAELTCFACGLLHVFIRHTSASVTINECVAPEVLADFQSWFADAVREEAGLWTHSEEGPDDMPAHIKSSLLGTAVTVPIRHGMLAFGRYQGIYLCEHRTGRRPRDVVLTVWGEHAGSVGV
jgi:secondary thiamine-phosphate synthase enzyme